MQASTIAGRVGMAAPVDAAPVDNMGTVGPDNACLGILSRGLGSVGPRMADTVRTPQLRALHTDPAALATTLVHVVDLVDTVQILSAEIWTKGLPTRYERLRG